MVMDFGFIKDILMKEIHDPCDHGLILYKNDIDMIRMVQYTSSRGLMSHTKKAYEGNSALLRGGIKLYILETVPTAENLAYHWYLRVNRAIEDRALKGKWDYIPRVSKMKVWETPNCLAVYPN